MPDLHPPVVITDGGPWASHDMACAVCRVNKAVIIVETGIFQPCWVCQEMGWLLKQSPLNRKRFLEVRRAG